MPESNTQFSHRIEPPMIRIEVDPSNDFAPPRSRVWWTTARCSPSTRGCSRTPATTPRWTDMSDLTAVTRLDVRPATVEAVAGLFSPGWTVAGRGRGGRSWRRRTTCTGWPGCSRRCVPAPPNRSPVFRDPDQARRWLASRARGLSRLTTTGGAEDAGDDSWEVHVVFTTRRRLMSNPGQGLAPHHLEAGFSEETITPFRSPWPSRRR